LRGRDFLTLRDFSSEEVSLLLRTASRLKEDSALKVSEEPLRGKTLLMIFQKPSTRTRVSFDVAMTELGGHAISLSWVEMQIGRGETIADTGRVLSRYGDAIMARVGSHEDLEELARHAEVPVINGLSDLCHPAQALSDLLTVQEKKGDLQGLKLAYVGDGSNVCNSLLAGCAQVGVDISVACARGYEPDSGFVRFARERGAETGAQVWVGTDPIKAVKGADVVYTDTFVSMGQEAERENRIKTFIPRYQVTPELFKRARKDAIFMHCLPAHRGEEVLSEVIDGPRSVVWDQAENRVHAQKAILASII